MKSLKRQFKILKSIKPDEIKREEFSQLIAEMSAGCRAPSFSWRHPVVFFRSVSALALISALFLAASGAGITFASQNALPGEVLYPAKLAIEKIRITAAKDTEKKTELRLEFASRRLDEVEKIVVRDSEENEEESRAEKEENVVAALDDYEKKLDDTEKVSPSDARESAKVYEKNIVELISRAEEKKFDGKVKERLKRAHERTKDKFKDDDKPDERDSKLKKEEKIDGKEIRETSLEQNKKSGDRRER